MTQQFRKKALPPVMDDPRSWLDKADRERARMFTNRTKEEAITDGITFANTLWHLPEQAYHHAKENDLPLARRYSSWQELRDVVIDAFPAFLVAGKIATEGKHYHAHDPRFSGCQLMSSTASAVGPTSRAIPPYEVFKLKMKDGTQPSGTTTYRARASSRLLKRPCTRPGMGWCPSSPVHGEANPES